MSSILKNAAMAAAVSLMLAAPVARAQDGAETAVTPITRAAEPQNLVDVNPLGLLVGDISIEYERAVTPYVSILAGPQLYAFAGVGGASGENLAGLGVTLSAHFFPGGDALHGFWIGPELDVEWQQITLNGVVGNGGGVGGFGILGYTFFPRPEIPISIGLGAGYRATNASVTDLNGNSASAGFNGFALTGRLAIGYAW